MILKLLYLRLRQRKCYKDKKEHHIPITDLEGVAGVLGIFAKTVNINDSQF